MVRAVEAAEPAHHLAQRDELVVGRIHARGIGQARGEPDRALREPLREQPLHLRELVAGRRAVVVAHCAEAQRSVRHEIRRIDGDPAPVEPVEVLADGAPAPVEARRIAVPARKLRAQLLEHHIRDGRVAEAVLAEQLECHALADLRLVRGLDEEPQIRVRVHVDEPGTDEEPIRVDGAPSRLVDAPDRCDAVTRDRDIGGERRAAGAVDHAASADEHVEHES